MSGFSINSDNIKEKPATAMLAPQETSKPNASMETQSTSGGGRKGRRKRNCKICICITILIFLLIFIVLLILGFTLFKPKLPITTIDSIAVERLRASFELASLKVVLNLTLHVDLSLKNPNRVGFSYDSSSALLNYRGQLIGEAPLPANRIAPEQTQPMNLTLTLMADRLLSDSELINDVMAGVIPLNTFVKVSGKVKVLKIFKLKVQSSSSCDLTISVSNRNVTSQHCKYSTKL
ncbi:Late embryogenesis abundant protein [Cardamine amara subsp. amara]|uniref:Late embryogenesis abundant protein n=1 Tax=Cardamine amara subsp. amara TaxID=228776 RepID=A0ABD1A824_CARAN